MINCTSCLLQMLGVEENNYFFQQKRVKRFQQRRTRKYDETQSVFSERKEFVTFHVGERTDGDATSVFGGGAAPSVKSFVSHTTATRGGPGRPTTASTSPQLRNIHYIDVTWSLTYT